MSEETPIFVEALTAHPEVGELLPAVTLQESLQRIGHPSATKKDPLPAADEVQQTGGP